MTGSQHIRRPALAGTFYAATADGLNTQVDQSFARRVTTDVEPPKALVAPHAGLVYSGPIAATAYATLRPDAPAIERIVLLGPSHHFGFDGFVIPAATMWQTPLGNVVLDRPTLQGLSGRADVRISDEAHAPEHSLEVHLPFLQRVCGAFTLVPILVGQITPVQGAALLRQVWGGPETRVVISSDLSHFFSLPHAREVDAASTAVIEALDADAMLRADACGRYPVAALLHEAKRRGMHMATLDVRTSADTAGDPTRVVGYGSYAFWEPEQPSRVYDDTQRRVLIDLARASIEDGLARGAGAHGEIAAMRLDLSDAPAWQRSLAATFVTLKRPRGRLRGCIGTLRAHQALAQDVVDHAFAAAFRDPRFPPLQSAEVHGLDLHLSVLSAPEPFPVTNEADACARLRPGVDGVLLSGGKDVLARHRATFLPQVWDSLPEPEAFLRALKQKAGLAPDHWPVALQTYTVEEWHDEPSPA